MSTHVGDIFFDAKVDRKQYDKDMSSLEKGAGAIGSKIGKKLSMAIGGAIATMGIGQLINKVGTLGDTVDKMSQKLGMSNKAYQEWDYIMQRCGANIDSMTVAMKTLASSVMTSKDALKELGISQEEALGMSQQELFSRVITALQGIEDKTRRTYLAGQLLGRGATELGAVLNLTQQDMENMRSRVANLGGVMSDLAVKNSAMFKDSLLDIRMAFKGIANSIAEYVLPIITSAVNRVIIPALLRIAQAVRLVFGFISRLVGGIRSTFGKVGGAFKSAFGKGTQKDMNSSAKSIGNVGSGLGKAGGNANKAKKAVQALKRELFGFDRITKLTKQDASTGTSGAGGAGGGGGGLGDLGGIGDVEGYEQASNFFSGLEELEIPPALSESLDNLKRAFSGLFDVLGEFGQWALDEILIPLGQWALNDGIPAGLDVLAGAIDVITEALKLLGTILKPIWDSLLKPFFDWWLGFQADKMQTVASVLTKLAEAIAKIREKIEGWKEKSAEIKVTLTDKLTSAWNKVKGVWDKVKSKTATVSLKLSNGFSTAWSKVKKAWESIKSKTATIKLQFTEAIKTKWNAIARKVNSARANSALARTLIPSNLPLLAQGGYVKRNTPQLAVIGDNPNEGEIVAPESKLLEMAKAVAGSGNAQTVALLTAILQAINAIDTNVYLDGEAIKNNTVKRINQHTRTTGRLELIV